MTRPIYIDYAADLYEFNSTVEFDVLSMSATCQERYYKYSHHAYPEVTFYLRMRRRTIFYTLNIMMPCVAISALMLLTFYLPPESREKISLSINIFISLTLFFLLISETIPPTSLAVPLLGKYLLFTIILITSSIVSTVMGMRLAAGNHKYSSLHHWQSGLSAPKKTNREIQNEGKLSMEMHQHTKNQQGLSNHNAWTLRPRPPKASSLPHETVSLSKRSLQHQHTRVPTTPSAAEQSARPSRAKGPEADSGAYTNPLVAAISQGLEREEPCVQARIGRKLRQVMHGTDYIAQRVKDVKMEDDVKEDWQFVAVVVDRLCLWVFSLVCTIAVLSIIFKAPSMTSSQPPLDPAHLPNSTNLTSFVDAEMRIPRQTVKIIFIN
ncbi:unnamed protein product [Dibothriocephalus latus]|uniref:Neurotransmitter-gated ion-channel transmembrane domain-containing protein n=1 Tax=Dibothriocephalus latus TaxID=60516 RepID=A0A3P6UZD4_DIBLA|nr:unnamed protein product [Dibothriocephalus latus]